MDKDVLGTKLEALIRCVHRIESQNVNSLDELERNLDKQEIIILNYRELFKFVWILEIIFFWNITLLHL